MAIERTKDLRPGATTGRAGGAPVLQTPQGTDAITPQEIAAATRARTLANPGIVGDPTPGGYNPQMGLPAQPDPYNFNQDYLGRYGDFVTGVLGSQAPTIDQSGMQAAQASALGALGQDQANIMNMAQNDASRQHLMQLANGQGPAAEAAQAQLRAGMDAANAQAMSQAASARGGAGQQALAMRGAMNQGAMGAQQAANQAAAMRAQMSMQGIQGLSQQRAENMNTLAGLANTRAGLGQNFVNQTGSLAGQQAQLTGQYDLGKFGIANSGIANIGNYGLGVQQGAIGAQNAATNAANAQTQRIGSFEGQGNRAQNIELGKWEGIAQTANTVGNKLGGSIKF